jgi:predicted nuclease of predicted toxin-antitoxin system
MSPARSFLIDQMFDRLVVAALRNEGYDAVADSEIGMATADDAEIMGSGP